MGADVDGWTARLTDLQAADQSPMFPTEGTLNQGPGNQGSAMDPIHVQGQTGTEGLFYTMPRSLGFGNTGLMGAPDT